MKKIITITTVLGLLALPGVSGALTVRTEHRTSSGGVTVSEGGATATGDQNSSVSVQNVISGTRGHVQVTTVKDGDTTTESHDINGGGTVIVTPAPQPEPDNTGRTPRAQRGVVAIQASNSGESVQSVTVRTNAKSKNSPNSTNSVKKSNSPIFAAAYVSDASRPIMAPSIVNNVQLSGAAGTPAPMPSPFTRILRWCGLSI